MCYIFCVSFELYPNVLDHHSCLKVVDSMLYFKYGHLLTLTDP